LPGGAGGAPTGPRGAVPEDDGAAALLDRLLIALRSGSEAGAATLWAALTARARGPLGDVEGAHRALRNELLGPLVGHERADVAPWEHRGDAARTHVRVVGAAGGPVALYLVSARREADGAWRLTGLRRDDLPWG
jgi:hypothetical protein